MPEYKVYKTINIDVRGRIEADSLDEAVRIAIGGGETDWEYLYDSAVDSSDIDLVEVGPVGGDTVMITDYATERGWTPEDIENIRRGAAGLTGMAEAADAGLA